ncbi:Uncharacterised protein [Mycobacterium tuberculosis]|nr:Uncharacterised protein [Mycobacterium tuberculosis]
MTSTFILEHGVLLRHTRLRHRRIASVIVPPRRRGSAPIVAFLHDGTLNVQHLQQKLQGGAAQLNARLQSGNAQPLRGLGEVIQHRQRLLLIGHGGGRKILPNGAVFATGQEQNISVDGTSTGTTNLLVVAHRRRRRAQVHHKTQIRLIKTHTESTRCYKSLDTVFLERLLRNQALIRVSFAGVGEHLVATGTQSVCGIFCRRNGQRIDNAGTGQVVQVCE